MRLGSPHFSLFLALSACSGDDAAPVPGHEHGPCTCLEGLQCIDDVCTPPSAASGEASTNTSSGGDLPDRGTDGDVGGQTEGMTDGGGTDDGEGDDDGGADSTGDGGPAECNPPVCSSYEAKMKSCFPDWNYDSYDECVYIFEVCNGIGSSCAEKTPTVVNCRLSSSCDDLLDCNQGTQC
jgi:hypothetical protein